ncbi:hypothetical protein MVEN_00151500 [Mycena venus]|uniref:Arrestin-like N-terminal domain-containing protein n=1 Tax=Mycena venus TaxID=2733690 RepID=A0A8H6Z0C9_9AGAR|nr:hypothetical protein MVEN_00151500 [Mycena venus]
MMEPGPPSYSDNSTPQIRTEPPAPERELPAYTRRPTPPPAVAQVQARLPKEFTYQIKTRGRNPSAWATLTVHGDPRLSKVGPTVTEGSNVAGEVKLTLRSPETIQAVCILIRGEILKDGPVIAPIVFLESKHTVWSAVEGAPEAAEIAGKSTVKLNGGETFLLPHTFSNPGTFNIRYSVELRIVRGKLRPDDKVTCALEYFSMQQPGPPSALRQLAYQENSPLFGPEADPEGWNSQSLSVKGIIFASRTIDLKFTFSLANPLTYTRSGSIPCFMTIETSDVEALDLLFSPTASMAVFWTSTEGAPGEDSSHRRHLIGEIHLKANLQPSTSVVGFRIEYTVVVFPFQAAVFKPLDNKPLL